VLAEVHRLAARRQVRFSAKAVRELAVLDLALDEEDALQVLSRLKPGDLVGRVESEHTPEWLYVFERRGRHRAVREADREDGMRSHLVPRRRGRR